MDITPIGIVDLALRGDLALNNTIQRSSSNQFQLNSSYSGTSYNLGSFPTSAPLRIGAVRGDKIRLVSAGPNSGMEFTLLVPNLWIVEETIPVDATYYEFEVIRRDHNILTVNGKNALLKLMSWQTIGSPDIPFTNDRVRWIGCGNGSLPEIDTVQQMLSPITITTGPSIYMVSVDAPSTHLAVNWVRYSKTFGLNDLSHTTPVTVREAGLYLDEDSGGGPGLNPGVGTNTVMAYRTFGVGLEKSTDFTLTIRWDFRF